MLSFAVGKKKEDKISREQCEYGVAAFSSKMTSMMLFYCFFQFNRHLGSAMPTALTNPQIELHPLKHIHAYIQLHGNQEI